MPNIRARYDIYSIAPPHLDIPGEGESWFVRGRMYDPTGSFSPDEVTVGDYIICMDYSPTSEVVYERFKVKYVVGYHENYLDLIVEFAETTAMQGVCQQPRSGSFPLVSKVKTIFTNPASCDILQFESHYEAAIEYYNLLDSSSLSQLLDWGTFTEDTDIDETIESGIKLVTVNFRNTGPAITLTLLRLEDNYEIAFAEVGENSDAVQSINIPGLGGTKGFRLTANTWNGNSVHITVNVETIFLS